MKKSIVYTIIFLVCLNTALASITLSEYECEDERCKEGTKITFRIGVFNNINKTIKVNDIIIREAEGKLLLDPIYTHEHDGVLIEPREEKIFEFTEIITAPKKGYTHYYTPCFKTSIWVDGVNKGGGEVCDKVVKDFTVLPLSKIDCEDDSECAPGEYCDERFFKCKSEEVTVVQPEDKSGKYDDLKYYLLAGLAVVFVLVVSYWLIFKEE